MLSIGIVKETGSGERRVAITPDLVPRLRAAGLTVLVEAGAGAAARFPDGAYAQAGAEIVDDVRTRADVLACVGRPPADRLRAGQLVVGLLHADPAYVADLTARGVIAADLDRVPRTISAAQPMDARTSQENVAGYRAAILAACTYERFFPLLVTAAGTARPAQVLVLGAGVAGLSAIGTARRLGAVVTGYDIRPQARAEIASLGANVLDLTAHGGDGEGGYARALTEDEQRAERDELGRHVARHDVLITTALVPGRRPPLLVDEAAVKEMRPGSVIVDLAGGNVEATRPGETYVTENGVTVIDATGLPATMPAAASTAYAHNVCAFLTHVLRDGALALDPGDEIQRAVIVTGIVPRIVTGGAA
ncbi:NAD(P) transhydrogenase alpha subunit [[Actinomadura] parvosata subsp. kistnae]|uniref:proton-translocating NAD(P)(+) transhydrogenase n=1 Tax=[Actinomadura] parvosata subsp. kistnae TaxID=1909395 RepID=A0A1U9ZZ45_9ACTN|nr:NAD(P) transhydrogenase subunit alpha [Nonomuraea sp. ATCC 55076]AQZ63231.1 NAD(P) transhydrogenase subunit alpha [Nonomuraea sp. ATCC 55076]SPL98909.1 NAD(P) transhydrogenase alpha subunit [Actinomadura parvosata subsp. kistnae]